ncbi:M23 family metallopeptidase [Nakamurella sp. GG22]
MTGTDGAVYLVYELYLTNATSTRVTIDSVQALDSDTGAVLQTRSGADLVAHSKVIGTEPGGTPPSSVVLDGGQLAIVWVDPSVEAGETVPTSVGHQVKVTFASAPNPLIPAELTETVATTQIVAQEAPVVNPPLTGKNWFDGNGCCNEVTPHRGAANPINGQFRFAERFAIDWVQLNGDLELTTGDNTKLSSYPYYGAPVLAVSDGTIVAVSDELQDQTPGSNPPVGSLTLDQYGGNYVVQQFEQNGETYYAFYAHLKPGTAKARVSVGETVQAGDLVGELGNSGNTDAPHLHFHVMDGPDPLASNGVPYRFDSLQLVGQATGDAAVDTVMGGQPLPLAPDGGSGTRTDSLPLYLDLVDLAASGSAASGSSSGSPESPSGSPGSSTGSSSSGPASSDSAPSGSSSSGPPSSGSSPSGSSPSGSSAPSS